MSEIREDTVDKFLIRKIGLKVYVKVILPTDSYGTRDQTYTTQGQFYVKPWDWGHTVKTLRLGNSPLRTTLHKPSIPPREHLPNHDSLKSETL